jgi:hypothetical protein
MTQASKPTADRAIELHLLSQGASNSYGSARNATDAKTSCYALPVFKRVVLWGALTAASTGLGLYGIALINQEEANPSADAINTGTSPMAGGIVLSIFSFLAAGASGIVCLGKTIYALRASDCCKKDLDLVAPLRGQCWGEEIENRLCLEYCCDDQWCC